MLKWRQELYQMRVNETPLRRPQLVILLGVQIIGSLECPKGEESKRPKEYFYWPLSIGFTVI